MYPTLNCLIYNKSSDLKLNTLYVNNSIWIYNQSTINQQLFLNYNTHYICNCNERNTYIYIHAMKEIHIYTYT